MIDPFTAEQLLGLKRILALGSLDKQLVLQKLKENGKDVTEAEYDDAIKQFLNSEVL